MSERIALFLDKLEHNPDSLLNRFSLAQAYFESGNYEQAIIQLTICIEKRTDWMLASLLLGKALIESGKKDEASVILKQTIILARKQGHEDPEQEAKLLLAECV